MRRHHGLILCHARDEDLSVYLDTAKRLDGDLGHQ